MAMVDSPRTTPPSSPEHLRSQGDLGLSKVALKRPLLEANSTACLARPGTTKRKRMTAGTEAEKCTSPPVRPPGEAFANKFLNEYEDTGRTLTSAHVLRLASTPTRKWGLACELPAGWYLIDDDVAPGQVLPHFDSCALPLCGWKVTGPQVKTFNPDVPVQIRYGNPKYGCTSHYSEMRAAVYTLCQKDATGTVVEGDVKLIHVYVGRASRNSKKAVRRHQPTSRNRRTPAVKADPVSDHTKSPNVTDDLSSSDSHGTTPPLQADTRNGGSELRVKCSEVQPPMHPLQPPNRQPEQQRNTGISGSAVPAANAAHMNVYSKILRALEEACMPDAARVVQEVIAEHLAAVSTPTHLVQAFCFGLHAPASSHALNGSASTLT